MLQSKILSPEYSQNGAINSHFQECARGGGGWGGIPQCVLWWGGAGCGAHVEWGGIHQWVLVLP
jgi:hypothetical protein